MAKRKKPIVWTKICASCDHFISDNYILCDFCILSEVGLSGKGVYDALDYLGMKMLYPEEDVLKAIRFLKEKVSVIERSKR